MPRQAPKPSRGIFWCRSDAPSLGTHRAALIQIRRILKPSDNDRGSPTMTEAQFELMLGAFREQHNELRAIHEAALGKLRGISYALYIILGINLVILAGLAGLAGLALRDVPF
jgi:hypothetical protein